MSYPIEHKIVIAISSSALFDLAESDGIFEARGDSGYREWMSERADEALPRGKAFLFVKRFLELNKAFPRGEGPVEVVLLSRNDPEAGVRVFNTIRHYGLDIVRAAFLDGHSPYPYISAFGASLFLSANSSDVKTAIDSGLPAGLIVSSGFSEDQDEEGELRIAFDFDGVIADDAAEKVFRSAGGLAAFTESEERNAEQPLDPGPLKSFFQKLAALQKHQRAIASPGNTIIRTAIITARNAPAHERVINTLKSWGIFTDEIFFLGGIEKRRILEVFKPHLFFDDQRSHFERAGETAACVHVPFGVANESAPRP